MKPILTIAVSLMVVSGLFAQSAPQETQVRKAVQLFYEAFNTHDFGRVPEFTTEDWTHIHPFGGWTRGRDAVLKELKGVHSTFLKGVTDTPEEMEVRFATINVAVVTAPSKMSPHTYWPSEHARFL